MKDYLEQMQTADVLASRVTSAAENNFGGLRSAETKVYQLREWTNLRAKKKKEKKHRNLNEKLKEN